jgi:mannose-6-phosphate isomerase
VGRQSPPGILQEGNTRRPLLLQSASPGSCATAPEAISKDTVTGRDLHELWTLQREEIFGTLSPNTERFPILVKIIDAAEHLSLQVHPPEQIAASLGGEPKTEMWYFLDCQPGALIYAGFSEKISREKFLQAARAGSTELLYHKIHVKSGDAMFLPSGRVHAIGAGNFLLEVQQNSDTTYRVDDWGRVGLDGKPRELHLEQAVRCIDFDDVRPGLQSRSGDVIVQCPFFTVQNLILTQPFYLPGKDETFVFIFNEKGRTQIGGHTLTAGNFALLPAHSELREIRPLGKEASVVLTTWGRVAPVV